MSEWRQSLHRHFQRAVQRGLPVFGAPERQSTPFNSTPYVVAYTEFVQRAAVWPGRGDLITALQECYSEALRSGVAVDALLLGGSFVDFDTPNPHDLDGIWLFRSAQGRGHDVEHLLALQRKFKQRAIDARFVPLDSDPILLLKSVSFFSILYSKQQGDMTFRRGLLLVDCAGVA